jgi:hypothetical protein
MYVTIDVEEEKDNFLMILFGVRELTDCYFDASKDFDVEIASSISCTWC